MEQNFGIDIDEIRRVVDEAEVFIVRFPRIERRLLVDARAADDDPPMIRIVPRVSSAAERAEVAAAIRGGEGFETVWERASTV